MGTSTKIEWSDYVWNPLAGCARVSPGCDHCYAAVMARRLGFMAEADLAAGRDPGQKRKYIGITNKNNAGRIMFNGRVNLDDSAIDEPLRWKKPRRVFVNSMSDLFHKDVPDDFILNVFRVMERTPQHTYQVLTKRPERMAEWVGQRYRNNPHIGPASNIWLGTSVENQEQADARIPHLLATPAHVRFLSCEPLLGPVNLRSIPIDERTRADVVAGAYIYTGAISGSKHTSAARIQWVIVGGESGPGARPMHPDWAHWLRNQCSTEGVSFFFKQWGEWAPISYDQHITDYAAAANGTARWHTEVLLTQEGYVLPSDAAAFRGRHIMRRVGKHAAGRLLDGREWNEFPV